MPENSATLPPLEGELAGLPFARIFFELCRAKTTGHLDLMTAPPPAGKVLKRIIVSHGASFVVQGGGVDETLGRVLVAQGKLPEDEHEKMLAEAGKDYGRLEQLIQSGNRFPPHELLAALAAQARLKIKRCFALSRGYYKFTAQPDGEIAAKHVLHQLEPEKLLLEGVREFYPPGRIGKEFAGIEKKVFQRTPRLAEFAPRLGLPAPLLRNVTKLPESFPFGPTARGLDAKPEVSHPLLLALYLGGMLSLPSAEEDFPLGREAAPPKPKTIPPETKKAAPPTPAPAPPKIEEPKLPIEELLDRELSDQDVLKEIERLHQLIAKKETTCFDILGVEQKTPPAKIKKIYFKLAKVFHPDARTHLYQGPIKSRVEDLFTKISEAYNTLSDPDVREKYLRGLQANVSDEQMAEAHRAIEAETEFNKAEVFLRKGNWKDAEALLRRAVELMPNEPEYKLHHAWADYKVQGPGRAGQARKVIEAALKERPRVINGHYYLGQICKAEGDEDGAEKAFRKVVEMDAHHIEAQRELRLMSTRREKAAPKKGLFGRKG